MKLGIQTTLTLFFSIIIVLSLPVLLWIAVYINSHMIDRQVRIQLTEEAADAVETIALLLRPVEEVLGRLAESYSLQEYARLRQRLREAPESAERLREDSELAAQRLRQEFQSLLRPDEPEIFSEFSSVVFVNRQSQIELLETSRSDSLSRESIIQFAQLCLDSTDRSFPLIQDLVQQKGTLRFAMPVVRDENVTVEGLEEEPEVTALIGSPVEEVEGVLVLDYRFSALRSLLLSARVPGAPSARYFLVDSGDRLLAAPNRNWHLLQDFFEQIPARRVNLEPVHRLSHGGRTFLLTVQPYSTRGWYVGILAQQSDFTAPFNDATRMMIIASILLFGVALLIALWFIHRIASPLKSFVGLARQIAGGNFNVRVSSEGSKEIADLSMAFNDMAHRLQDYLQQVRVKEQMQQELRIAHDIQIGLLPRETPEVAGLSLYGRTIPALEIGGDYYDFISLGDGKVGVVVGDVTGRGVPAALLVTMVRTLLRSQVMLGSPHEILLRINALLQEDLEGTCHSVALQCALYDPARQVLHYSNAGQLFPLWFRSRLKKWEYVSLSGLPLGIRSDAPYVSSEISLEPGDRIVLYTDGLVDARNENQELFGFERLEHYLAETIDLPAQQCIDGLLSTLQKFTGRNEPDDDLTVVVLDQKMD